MEHATEHAEPTLTRRTFVGAAAAASAAAAVGLAGCGPKGAEEAQEGAGAQEAADPYAGRRGVLHQLPAGVPAPQPEGVRGGRKDRQSRVVRTQRLRGVRARHRPQLHGRRPRTASRCRFCATARRGRASSRRSPGTRRSTSSSRGFPRPSTPTGCTPSATSPVRATSARCTARWPTRSSRTWAARAPRWDRCAARAPRRRRSPSTASASWTRATR